VHNEGAVFVCDEDRLELLHLRTQHEDLLLQCLVHHLQFLCLLLQTINPVLLLSTAPAGCSPMCVCVGRDGGRV